MFRTDLDDETVFRISMVGAWIALPSSALFILCLHYLLGLSGLFLYIIIGIFSVCLLSMVILTTLAYNLENITLAKIASFIAAPFTILGFIFWIGFFVIFGFINHYKEYIELGFWKYVATFICFFIAFVSLFSVFISQFLRH